jgi:hypothetical protein
VRRWPAFLGSCAGRAVVFPAFLVIAASLVPGIAAADGFGGYLDFGYFTSASDSTDALGNTSRTESNAFSQRYNLSLSRTLYPYLKLSASGLFDKVDSATTINGTKTESSGTRVQPQVDLTLRSPVYTAGARYNRREETTNTSVSPATTNISDMYTGILGLTPLARDLPSGYIRVERSHIFDQEHISQDRVRDYAMLTMQYTPTDKVVLRYRPSYTAITDRLSTLETRNLSQVGRVEYADSFFQNRVSFNTSYNVNYNEQKTSVGGTGTVDIGLDRFSGLSSIDDTPVDGALASNAALIDGNLAASAGINIGLPLIGGDTRERNIGLDFSLAQEVNTLRVWVDRELPAAISGSFSWDIYTSSDNVTWGFYTTLSPAPFGLLGENRFEITFSPVKTRYIKVVVRPLQPAAPGAAGYPDIFVTEIQAFSRKSAEAVRGTKSSSSQVYNFDGRALLLESANLYYGFSYFFAKSEPSSEQRWTLSNMLMASHRFNRVFSGSANAGREDFSDPVDSGFAYIANASLEAVPLKTLRHTLAYSGRFAENESGRFTTNTLFLNNNAQVYRGVDLLASGGLTVQDQASGVHVESTTLLAGANLQPHNTLNLNFFLDTNIQHTSGGGKQESSTRTTRMGGSATYHPVETLYLVAGTSIIDDPLRTRRSQNYALNWSPFFDGALQFAFAYNENLESEQNTMVRTFGPSLTWRITRTTHMTAAYQVTQITSDSVTSDSTIFSTSLRVYL